MISYRELAMRALGRPPRTPASSPRPAAHRVTALALTAAMASALASPAFAGWTIDMSKVEDDVTIEKKSDGTTTIKVGSGNTITVGSDTTSSISGVRYENDGDDKITVTGNNTSSTTGGDDDDGGDDDTGTTPGGGNSGSHVTLEAPDDNTRQPVMDDGTSGQEPVASGQTDEEEGGTADPVPTPVVTWPDAGTSGQQSVDSDQTDEEEDTDDPANEMVYPDTGDDTDGGSTGYTTLEADGGSQQPVVDEGTSGQEPVGSDQTDEGTSGQTDHSTLATDHSTLATDSKSKADDDDNEPETYLGKAAKTVTKAASNAFKKILNIINNSSEELDVTLKDATIDATGTGKSALTVSGSGDTTLTLEGESTLTGDTGKDGLSQTGTGSLTITGGESDKLTATGGNGTGENQNGGDGISADGKLSIEGGNVTATGGVATSGTQGGTATGGAGISGNGVTISGTNTTVNANGGSLYDPNDNNKKNQHGSGGDGIRSSDGVSITGSGTTVNANGGSSGKLTGNGGAGIRNSGSGEVSISGGTVNATGGVGSQDRAYDHSFSILDGDSGNGGDGIVNEGDISITGGTVNATGGDTHYDHMHDNYYGKGGDGIRSNSGSVSITGSDSVIPIVTAIGGGGGALGELDVPGFPGRPGGDGIYGKGDVTIEHATVKKALGGDSKGGDTGHGIRSESKVYVKNGATIEIAQGGSDGYGGDGIQGAQGVEITDSTIGKLKNDGSNEADLTSGAIGGYDGNGIASSSGDVTISDSTIYNAKSISGGTDGIVGENVKITGGTIHNVEGGYRTGGVGIKGRNSVTIKDALIKKVRGNGYSTSAQSYGGSGIYGGTGGVTIEGNAVLEDVQGGETHNNLHNSSGIYSDGDVTIKDNAQVTAKGGNYDNYSRDSVGDGIYSKGTLTIQDNADVTASGTPNGYGGNGLYAKIVKILGGTVQAFGGDGNNIGQENIHGMGIYGDTVTISGGTVTATGGKGDDSHYAGAGGHGIYGQTSVTIEGTATIAKAEGGAGCTTGSNGNGGNGIYSEGTVLSKTTPKSRKLRAAKAPVRAAPAARASLARVVCPLPAAPLAS